MSRTALLKLYELHTGQAHPDFAIPARSPGLRLTSPRLDALGGVGGGGVFGGGAGGAPLFAQQTPQQRQSAQEGDSAMGTGGGASRKKRKTGGNLTSFTPQDVVQCGSHGPNGSCLMCAAHAPAFLRRGGNGAKKIWGKMGAEWCCFVAEQTA